MEQQPVIQRDRPDGQKGVHPGEGEKISGDAAAGRGDRFRFRRGDHKRPRGGIQFDLAGAADGGAGVHRLLPGGRVSGMCDGVR